VIGGDEHGRVRVGAASTTRPMHASIGLERADRRRQLAGVPDHVGVGVVDQDERGPAGLSASSTLSVTGTADISGARS
jgi:hypothetical protein